MSILWHIEKISSILLSSDWIASNIRALVDFCHRHSAGLNPVFWGLGVYFEFFDDFEAPEKTEGTTRSVARQRTELRFFFLFRSSFERKILNKLPILGWLNLCWVGFVFHAPLSPPPLETKPAPNTPSTPVKARLFMRP